MVSNSTCCRIEMARYYRSSEPIGVSWGVAWEKGLIKKNELYHVSWVRMVKDTCSILAAGVLAGWINKVDWFCCRSRHEQGSFKLSGQQWKRGSTQNKYFG